MNQTIGWQEFANETTVDLVEYMRDTGPDGRSSADAAFYAFIIRFREYVQKLCRQVAAGYGYDDTVADDVADDTFRKFRSTTFDFRKCKTSNLERCVQIYLSLIAKSVLNDYYRKKSSQNPFDGTEDISYDLPEMTDLDNEPERTAVLKKKNEIMREVLYNRLSDKHRIIYLTYKQYESDMRRRDHDEETGNPRRYNLPRHLTAKLRAETGLAQSTISKYKIEAENMIETLLKIYGNQ